MRRSFLRTGRTAYDIREYYRINGLDVIRTSRREKEGGAACCYALVIEVTWMVKSVLVLCVVATRCIWVINSRLVPGTVPTSSENAVIVSVNPQLLMFSGRVVAL